MTRRSLAGAVMLLLFAIHARAAEPCCAITAIDAGKGIVTARVKSTGQIFKFEVKTPAVLHSLKIGQEIYANLSTKQVSLDGRTVCCAMLSAIPGAPALPGKTPSAPLAPQPGGSPKTIGKATPLVAPQPCCAVTATDVATGIVSARVNATGQTFQFGVKDAATLKSLKVGQPIYANLAANQISVDGRTLCVPCIVAPGALGCNGQIPVTLLVNPQSLPYPSSTPVGAQVILTAEVTGGEPPQMLTYNFVALVPLNGDPYPLGGGSSPGVQWTPKEAGDFQLTATVRELVPTPSAGLHPPPPIIPCGTATVNNYHVKPQTVLTVTLSANPSSQKTSDIMQIPYSLPGSITLNATGGGTPPGFFNKFLFSYSPYWQYQAPPIGQGAVSSEFPLAKWTINPQPVPGLYTMGVDVQTFTSGNSRLVAEGTSRLSPYLVLIPPQPCPTPAAPANPTVPFGWVNPITTQNTTQPVGTPQQGADCAIAGYNINDIANNPQVRVRKINVSCTNCHMGMMAGTTGRSWFCGVLPNGFPHYSSVNPPPPNNETTLYNLLADWKNRGCPD